ncbi:MAG: recombinase family protein [Candidatus Thermoplasmatota archaeon]|nr:recombinase family protein [Candidatus Thermoplasmatota archaeon]
MIVCLYARVTTKDKGQTPENQLLKLKEYCRSKEWEYREHKDYASGTKKDCLGLKSIMTDLDHLGGILAIRLDGFGRSLQNLPENLNQIRSQGKFFESIDQGFRISEKKDPMNEFMLAVLGSAVEFERDLISERVRDGMARARNENKKIGRPVILQKRGVYASLLMELKREGKSIMKIFWLVAIKNLLIKTNHGSKVGDKIIKT